jgi:hypothetical protein
MVMNFPTMDFKGPLSSANFVNKVREYMIFFASNQNNYSLHF